MKKKKNKKNKKKKMKKKKQNRMIVKFDYTESIIFLIIDE
jgi:hypothetical protein